ncbi:hypothetical protein H632_c994p2 [Helicosporidium sp. ATCC 50920]|nr:hypothetical protein H632_c994p2 [Helicosporidium sp. ATCC 50920]|eukprot:KDD74911.1 hypothetical protein H632_c994p2 [Helicosporidium sp. ATCC 50920]
MLVALLQPVFFFATGHLCEFAGLRWTAGFVGFAEFDLVRGAVLVAIDTFGGWALGMCLLAQLLEPLQERAGQNKRALRYVALAALGTGRAATALAATLSAAVQRRHLYVWALFAPRFVFEALFLLLADLGGLVMLG